MSLAVDLVQGDCTEAEIMAFETTTHSQTKSSEHGVTARNPLRIGIFSYRSDPRVGGQGVYLDYLTRALVEAGQEVSVVSGPPYPSLDPRVNVIQLPSLDLYAKPHNGHYALRPRHLLSAVDTYEYFGHLSGKFVEPYTFGERSKKYLLENPDKFDVLLDNQSLSQGLWEASRKLGLPLVTMIHHPITEDRRLELQAAENWKQRWLVKRWYAFHHMQVRVARQLPCIITPSQSGRQHIADEFGLDAGKVSVIPLGVDQDAFKPNPALSRAPARIVTTASADVPLKGLIYLIEAYAMLLKAYPDLELCVIGKLRDGPTADRIKALGLTDRIEFKSSLTREEVAHEFQTASLLVSPSLYEGFGLPAAEAMSCGTPVVVTDGGALPEVAGTAGKIVAKGDAAALADGIAELLDDPAGRAAMGEACRERAAACFDWQKIAPQYLEIFESVRATQC